MKKILIYIFLFFTLTIAGIALVNFYVLSFSTTNYYYNVDGLDNNYIGLVFGASVKSNNEPSDILKDRLKVAYKAYISGKIEKIILSGDNSNVNYNEPIAMQKYLLKLGVEEDDLYLDYAGFDTYDSLFRAKEIFGVEKIVLFTQDFHLKRAMYISKKLGIETLGVETNLQKYLGDSYNNKREIFARIKAFLDVDILSSSPKYLGEQIEIITDEKIEKAKKSILDN